MTKNISKSKILLSVAVLCMLLVCTIFATACGTEKPTFNLYYFHSWDYGINGSGGYTSSASVYLNQGSDAEDTLCEYLTNKAEVYTFLFEDGVVKTYSTMTHTSQYPIEVYTDIDDELFVDKSDETTYDGKTMWRVTDFENLPLIEDASYFFYQYEVK